MNILLCVTGSVAAIKLLELHDELAKVGKVQVVVTESALKIIKHAKIGSVGLGAWDNTGEISKWYEKWLWFDGERKLPLLTEQDEWKWEKIGDPILHVDLKDWADILVCAPLTANTLAKMAYGICDNLVTCIYRAWPQSELVGSGKPIVIAPAMNTNMWNSGHTGVAIDRLRSFHSGLTVVMPVEKKLACGTTGIGAMADPKVIAEYVRKAI
jgi:phosphopantothenoylcysteine synthetase/decarboxylase